MPDHRAIAQQHVDEAERIVAAVTEHAAKRGRKLGLEQQYEIALANTHATLALYHQRESA
jgi:hypothetical protein